MKKNLFQKLKLQISVITLQYKTDTCEIYLPKGTWFDYFTKEKIESTGMWITKKVDLKTMPIYVKEGIKLKYCNAKKLQNGMGEIVRTEEYK